MSKPTVKEMLLILSEYMDKLIADNALLTAKVKEQQKIIGEVEGYLSSAEVGSMSSNNSQNLAGELLQMIESINHQ